MISDAQSEDGGDALQMQPMDGHDDKRSDTKSLLK